MIGQSVIYGLHGKCSVIAIESRTDGNASKVFYKLEKVRSALSRSARPEPAIWVPVDSAPALGLRAPLSAQGADAVFEILQSKEYHFSLNEPWTATYATLERAIKTEGALGLAKAFGFLHVLRKKQVVPTPEVNRAFEQVQKLLSRELCEALSVAPRDLNERIEKAVRHKLKPDH